jgi:hypothetical protein
MQAETTLSMGIRRRPPRVASLCLLAAIQSAIFVLASVRPADAEVIDRVLAVVAGRLITLSDVNMAASLGLVTPPAGGDPIRAVLAVLIDRELQLAEVDRYAPPEPSPADVDLEVQRLRSRFESPEAFDGALATAGIDPGQLRETVREDLRIRAYLEQRFSARQESRDQVIEEWVAGLRRRADVIDLYALGR